MSNISINSLMEAEKRKKVEGIFKKITKEEEFEMMFYNYKATNKMELRNFLNILKYCRYRGVTEKLRTLTETTLDIIYGDEETNESYRITIESLEKINKYMEMFHQRQNHVIYTTLLKMEDDESVTIMKKKKDKKKIVDIDEFDMRVRMSSELSVSKMELEKLKKLDETKRGNIIFRFKRRISLLAYDDKEVTIRVDVTNTKMHRNINKLELSIPIYELEIELVPKKSGANIKYLQKMYDEATRIVKIVQQSNYVIGKKGEKEVLDRYADLLSINKTRMIKLSGRQPQSLEVQHVVEKLPDRYAVTDKADGERYFMIIYKKEVYLISNTLHVKRTGIKLKNEKYNDTIMDGEYIYLSEKNRHIYMCFDCLYKGGEDVRGEGEFMRRIAHIDEVIENNFILKGQTGYKIKEYVGEFNTEKIASFYDKEIDEYMKNLNADIEKEKGMPLVRRKYFLPVYGGKKNEIFKYSSILWDKFVISKSTKCPYILDGLIYQPLNQKYIVSAKESKYIEYKWKPQEKNSIDFYVLFERNRETGQVMTLYDNSREEMVSGQPYKIAHLYVGKMIKGKERPTLFKRETNKYIAQIYLKEGEARDEEGNILQDATVIEFYYNNDPNIPERHRWVPMRTRYGKTEAVQRYGKQYGNYSDIANIIWRSISNPVTINDINILSNDRMYEKHNAILRGKIDHSTIMSERKENIYYQIRTTLAKPMRNFHNWIKSILIYTHCNPIYEKGRNLTILDIACGKGGDIMKFYYARIDYYVGIDIDNESIVSRTDGAISRYNQLRKTHANFPRMFFIHADGGTILDYREQNKVLGGMSDKNKILMNRFFSLDAKKRTRFDRINCQFAVHYFLRNETVWGNFLENVRMYLKPGGYMMITCYDARRIIEVLRERGQYTTYYTNTKGEKKVLFEIVRKYEELDEMKPIGVGHAIDIHNAFSFQEGSYITEYLVDRRFMEKEMLEKCEMELVETDLFDNQYNIHEEYFKTAIKYEENEKTRAFLLNAAEYYDKTNEVNKACYNMTELNRYYIFRRSEKIRNQKGGSIVGDIEKDRMREEHEYVFDNIPNLLNPTKFIKRKMTEDKVKGYSFMGAIHDILVSNEIVPKSVELFEFYNDIGFNIIADNEVEKEAIKELNKKLVIGHEYTESEQSTDIALNGMNILILETGQGEKGIKIMVNAKKTRLSVRDPSIILYREDGEYYPIYRLDGRGGKRGIFNTRMRLIKRLIEESKK